MGRVVDFRLAMRCLALALAVSAMVGCGGGGGDDSPGTFSLSTNSLTFHAISTTSTSLPPQTITATVAGVKASTLYLRVVSTGPAVSSVSNFTINGMTSGSASVYPTPQATLGVGSFSSTITVYACTTDPGCSSTQLKGSPQTINVTYTVDGVASSGSSLSYSIGNTQVAGDRVRSFSVTGHPVQSWTVTSGVPWLSVSPGNGSTSASTPVAASLVQGEIDSLPSGVYSGAINLSPGSAGVPVSIPVTLSIARSAVNYVSPYVAISGQSGRVIIRGEHFSSLTVTGLRFGSVDAAEFAVIGDTEIHATYPALTAGSYPVHVLNAQNIDDTRATLRVMDAPVHASAFLAYPDGAPARIIGLTYDAERGAIIAGVLYPSQGTGSSRLLRYAYEAGWRTPGAALIPNMEGFALTADGGKVLASHIENGTGDFIVEERDPVTLEQKRLTRNRNFTVESRSLVVANNGYAIITTDLGSGSTPILSYWDRVPSIAQLTPASFATVGDGVAGASADGSMVIIIGGTLAGGQFVRQYDPVAGVLTRRSVQLAANAVNINRHGTRLLLDQRVYDADLTLLGSLPSSIRAAVLAPLDPRAYGYDSSGRIRSFDLSSAPVGGIYPEVGGGMLLSTNPSSSSAEPVRMALSPDGGTVFIGGNMGIAVLPLP